MIYRIDGSKVVPVIVREASLPKNQSHDALAGHLKTALCADMGITDPYAPQPYVFDTFPSDVIYHHQGQLYRRGYTATQNGAGAAPTIKLGKTAHKVHSAYADSTDINKESVLLSGDLIEFGVAEKSTEYTKDDDTIEVFEAIDFDRTALVKESGAKSTVVPVKLIQPGWGSSAYYSEAVLKRDGPKVFAKGTHMMWNHPTDAQETDRPEGDLSDLAAVLTEDAHWDSNGAKGPGLYSKAKVFPDYAESVLSKGPHIGVSIRAGIQTHEATVEGRTGRVADKFVFARSVDFVTHAGAGGAPLVTAKESARVQILDEGSSTMDAVQEKALLDNVKLLTESVNKLQERQVQVDAENKTLRESGLSSSAVAKVSAKLTEIGVSVKESLIVAVCAKPVLKEGAIDDAWIKTIVDDLSESVVMSGGKVKGMGDKAVDETTYSEASMKETFKELGVTTESGLTAAMGGR